MTEHLFVIFGKYEIQEIRIKYLPGNPNNGINGKLSGGKSCYRRVSEMNIGDGKGTAVVEFALILPLLLLLVFGIIEFGLLLYNKAMLTNASREGARAGIVYSSDPVTGNLDRLSKAEITQVVNDYCQSYLITFGTTPNFTVTTNPDPTETVPSGQSLTVDVSYHYDFLLVPAFITNLTGGLDLVASTSMREE